MATSPAATSIGRSLSSFRGKPGFTSLQNGCPWRPAEPNTDARQTLRTVRYGRHLCAKTYKSLYILHAESRRRNECPSGARQTLRTVWFRGHGRLSAFHVAPSPSHVLQLRQNDVERRQRKIIEIHWKYKTNIAQRKNSEYLRSTFFDAFQKCCLNVCKKQHFESTH